MKNDPLVIRPFDKATDIAPLSAVWFDASLAAHPFLGRARLLEQRKLIEDLYLPSSETWVACRHDTPVGFISLLDGFIGGLFVSPGCPGQGIGLEGARVDRFRELSRRPTDDNGLPFELAHMQLVS